MKIMKNSPCKAITILMLLALFISGCSAGGYSGKTEDTAAADAGGYNGYREEKAEAAEVQETFAADGMSMPQEVSEDTADGAGILAPEVPEKEPSGRKLVKTVSLSMETRTFDSLKSQMEESISSFGGYIENSSYDATQGGQQYRYYYLCVRIPAEHLDDFVGRAGEMGTVTNKTENVEDVTLDYVDKTAYKESLQTEYERVTALLEKAEDLDQILALESKLSELRYEINSYESKLRTYDNQIDYSTVHIYISEVEYEQEVSNTVGSRIRGGFQSSLFAVRDFFVNTFVFLVSNLPVILLLAVIAVILVMILKKGKKRLHRIFPQKNRELSVKTGELSEKTADGSEDSTDGRRG